MPRGIAEIPELRLSVLEKLVTTFMSAPDLALLNMFGGRNAASDLIEWESMRGGRGMTPFVAPGSPAPRTAPLGIAAHSAKAAYWKEKMYFDEEFLNNIRQEGTREGYMDAKTRLARELAQLINRSNRRKEWMFAKMLFDGSFSYQAKGGTVISVDYDIPADNRVTLTTNYMWDEGSSKNILKDIQDGKRRIKEECGGKVNVAMCNSNVLKYLANDTTIRGILQKNAFGDGSLYKGNLHDIIGVNASVIGSLLDIGNFIVYDEMYEVRAWMTSAVTAQQTTWVSVDDSTDFVVGEKARLHDTSAGSYEDIRIVSVDQYNGKIQLAHGPTNSYRAAEDYITMKKYYVPDDKFVMMATSVDGEPIAEYMKAPFGVGRHYGTYTDRNEEWDPEGVFIRVQDKGLPVLYHRDAIYTIDVQSITADTVTSTTTTTSSSSTTTTTG